MFSVGLQYSQWQETDMVCPKYVLVNWQNVHVACFITCVKPMIPWASSLETMLTETWPLNPISAPPLGFFSLMVKCSISSGRSSSIIFTEMSICCKPGWKCSSPKLTQGTPREQTTFNFQFRISKTKF